MNCKVPFNVEFLIQEFGNTFYTRDLRAHREKVMFESQKALLPETQQTLLNRLLQKEYYGLKTLKEVYTKMKNTAELERIDARCKEIVDLGAVHASTSVDKTKKPQAIRRCLDEACHGFIMKNSWQCGICMLKACKHCMQKDDKDHKCTDEDIETTKLLLNNTKPCPKCGAMISKIDGCDQMWCVLCHTTFSWKSGEAITHERVHNPHYYEWMRRNSVLPREPGDIPGCNQLPDFGSLCACASVKKSPNRSDVTNLHRILLHMQAVEIPTLQTRDENFEKERELYLEGNLTESDFKRILGLHEQKSDRYKALRDIFDLFLRQGIDEINAILLDYDVSKHLNVLEELRVYCNTAFNQTCRKFNIMSYEIVPGFRSIRRIRA